MIQLNLPNVITIALAGALGYAVLAGISKLQGTLGKGGASGSSS